MQIFTGHFTKSGDYVRSSEQMYRDKIIKLA